MVCDAGVPVASLGFGDLADSWWGWGRAGRGRLPPFSILATILGVFSWGSLPLSNLFPLIVLLVHLPAHLSTTIVNNNPSKVRTHLLIPLDFALPPNPIPQRPLPILPNPIQSTAFRISNSKATDTPFPPPYPVSGSGKTTLSPQLDGGSVGGNEEAGGGLTARVGDGETGRVAGHCLVEGQGCVPV